MSFSMINEEKSKIVDLTNGGSFTFLGFEYRRIIGRNKKWRPHYAPKLKKRTALLAKLKEIFRQNVSQPVEGVIEKINPILHGWVNYFAVGDSSKCFKDVGAAPGVIQNQLGHADPRLALQLYVMSVPSEQRAVVDKASSHLELLLDPNSTQAEPLVRSGCNR